MADSLANLLVAVDGSPHADRALDMAIGIARHYGSALSLVTVVPAPVVVAAMTPMTPPQILESSGGYYRDVLDKAKTKVARAGIRVKTAECLEGHVVDELLGYVERKRPDLLLVGSRGLSTARRLLLGSVSDSLVHHVKCSILVVKKG